MRNPFCSANRRRLRPPAALAKPRGAMIRALPFFALTALSACASQQVSLEGLRPRGAEAIDPRVPLPSEPVAGPADRSLAARIADAEQRAAEGAAAFDRLLPSARAAAGQAGARGSESWIAAQELLSALTGVRAPVSTALAELDALGGRRVEAMRDIGVADRAQLFAAASRVAGIDADEQAAIEAIRARLAR